MHLSLGDVQSIVSTCGKFDTPQQRLQNFLIVLEKQVCVFRIEIWENGCLVVFVQLDNGSIAILLILLGEIENHE